MTTAKCPRCSEQVSVPDSANREATVRCPFCRDEYSLGEALDQLPPSLIVVSDFGDMSAPAEVDDEVAPWAALNLDDDDADEVALAPLNDDAPAAAFDFASGSATADGKPTAAVRPSSRARKPKGSPIKSILSIVIGGLMAFPIAQLILWYLPGDWKRDFGAGPIVAKYIHPLIVPERFRGGNADAESNSQPAALGSDSVIPDFSFGGGEFAQTGNSNGPNANENKKKANNPTKRQKTNDIATLSDEPAAEEQMSLENAAVTGTDVFDAPLEVPEVELGGLPLIDAPVLPTELPNAITRATEEPAPELAPQGSSPSAIEAAKPVVSSLAPGNIRNAPQVSADNVAQSVQAALQGSVAWDNDESSSPSPSLKRDFYLSFSKLGEALTFADRSDEQVAAQISETATLLHDVGNQQDKLQMIGDVANGWIAAGRERRKTDGICLYGVVKSVEPLGDLFETTVESAGQQIAVVSTSDPSESFAADRQVLILGTILDDPAKNLGGYEGSRAVVVLDGYHVNVSAE